jgi:hypothetical protein
MRGRHSQFTPHLTPHLTTQPFNQHSITTTKQNQALLPNRVIVSFIMTEIDNFWLGTALGAGANPKQFVSRSLLLRIPAQHAPHLWTLLRPSYELLYNTRILPQL